MTSTCKILLVESHEAYQLITTFWLDLFGYDYDVAVSGDEVLEKISENTYQLIFMDLYVSGINGYDLAKHIRKQESIASVQRTPIIGTSVDTLIEDYQNCLAAGMDDYIPKPFSEKLLEEKLGAFLGAVVAYTPSF